MVNVVHFFFFQAEDGIRDLVRSRGLGDVYKRQFEEFAARFDWAKVNPAGSIFNLDKLDWLNGVWILSLIHI